MSDKLGEIVSIKITREVSPITARGFKLVLIMGDKANTNNEGFPANPSRYKEFGSLKELADAGFDTKKAIYAAATALLSSPNPLSKFAVGYYDSATNETITDGLNEIVKINNDWYALLVTDREIGEGMPNDQEKASVWCETEKKLFVTASADPRIIADEDTGSIAKLASDASREHTAVIYSSDATQEGNIDPKGWADAAWVGLMLGKDPGSATWAYKPLVGISPDDSLTSSQRANILKRNANYYDTIAGAKGTKFGTTAHGEYIDVIIGIDWMKVRIQERIFARLSTLDKVPYTDAGVMIIKGDIHAVLDEAIRRQLLSKIEYLRAPRVADVDPVKKKDRLLPDVEFRAVLAGAIHKVAVEGVVTL